MKAGLLILTGIVAGCMSSCVMETPDGEGCERYRGKILVLNLEVEGGTRANPTPGDDGDGRLPGTEKESLVNDVNIFVYNAADLNAGADSPVTFQLYAERKDFLNQTTSTGKVERSFQVRIKADDYQPQEGDHILVLANYGSQYPVTIGTTKVKELAESVISRTWTGDGLNNPYGCNKFLMATAYSYAADGKVDPYKVYTDPQNNSIIAATTHIERMASRIDWMYKESNLPDENDAPSPLSSSLSSLSSCLIYPVEDKRGNDAGIGKVYLEKIMPVNLVQPGESTGVYMLKHLSEGTDLTAPLKWCLTETGSATSTVPTRYVVEPRTINKKAGMAEGTLSSWYGATAAASLLSDMNSAPYVAPGTRAAEASEAGSNTCTETGYDFDRFMVLTYCHENTQPMNLHTKDFITGLALQCIYRPDKVYSGYNADQDVLTGDAAYTTGADLWRFSPTDRSVSETESLYFSNEEALNAYVEAYKKQSDTPYVTAFYDDARCYYNVWLRHANTDEYNNTGDRGLGENDPHETFPMEYGIVRNNIYRMGVSFTGPGTPALELREPVNARFRIFVRKWNIREYPTISIPLSE